MVGAKVFDYEVEDSSAMLIELDNGSYATVEAFFNIPDAAARCRLEIYGAHGSMLAEGTIGQVEGGKLDVLIGDASAGNDAKQNRNDMAPLPVEVQFGNQYAKEIESFGIFERLRPLYRPFQRKLANCNIMPQRKSRHEFRGN